MVGWDQVAAGVVNREPHPSTFHRHDIAPPPTHH